MQVSLHPAQNTSFKAINRSFLRLAHEEFERHKSVAVYWIHKFGDDVFLFRDMSLKDGKDTIKTVENYTSEATLPVLKNSFKSLYA